MQIRTLAASLSLVAVLAAIPSAGDADTYGLAMFNGSGALPGVSFGVIPADPGMTFRLKPPVVSTRGTVRTPRYLRPAGGSQVSRLRHLIGFAEARRDGHDAVQHGATRKPGKRPTQMTLGEIYAWTAATPGQQHAIGRYQFIPTTLRALARRAGLGSDTIFSADLQDALADLLLEDAGFAAFRNGGLSRRGFMNNLARIWAGLPASTGRSHYHGQAGNRATISWATFDREMAQIFTD